MDLEMTDRWLSVEEIGEHLGVSKDTVYGAGLVSCAMIRINPS